MRLIKYLSYSGLDENTNKFRALSIKLSEKPNDFSGILSEVYKKYTLDAVDSIVESLNKELKKFYKGKYQFCFCLEEGTTLDKIKINSKYLGRLKFLQYEANSKLAKIKSHLENSIKETTI